jgi:hypothetical protein
MIELEEARKNFGWGRIPSVKGNSNLGDFSHNFISL